MGSEFSSIVLYVIFAALCAYFGFSSSSAPVALLSPLISTILGCVALAVVLPIFRILSYLDNPKELEFVTDYDRIDWEGAGTIIFMVLAVAAGGIAISRLAAISPEMLESAFAPSTLFLTALALLATLHATMPEKRGRDMRGWFANFFLETSVSALLLFALVLALMQPNLDTQAVLYRMSVFYLLSALAWFVPKKIAEPLVDELFY